MIVLRNVLQRCIQTVGRSTLYAITCHIPIVKILSIVCYISSGAAPFCKVLLATNATVAFVNVCLPNPLKIFPYDNNEELLYDAS